jgi:hypothetical protein
MPVEVSNWIDRAMKQHGTHASPRDRPAKEENADLKADRKFAEHRILRSEYE